MYIYRERERYVHIAAPAGGLAAWNHPESESLASSLASTSATEWKERPGATGKRASEPNSGGSR